jgi:hypothetical protein
MEDPMRKLTATLAAAVAATVISSAVFAQSGTYSVYITPGTGWISTNPTYPLHVTEQVYVYQPHVYPPSYPPRDYANDPNFPSRRVYMEEAGRRWDAMVQSGRTLTPYEADRLYGHPNPTTHGYPYYYTWPSLPAGSLPQDSNPNDHATGIYNPHQ